MIAQSPLERGATMLEMLVTVAILAVAMAAGAAMITSSHPNERTRTSSQLLGIVDRAHALAFTNGATLQIAPAGRGSILTLLNGFRGGSTLESVATDVAIALKYSAGIVTTAKLAIRRDGSWYPLVNNAEQPCTGSEALGLVGAQFLNSSRAPQSVALGESYPISCTDLHISVAQ